MDSPRRALSPPACRKTSAGKALDDTVEIVQESFLRLPPLKETNTVANRRQPAVDR
jgi:hypothetical protein